MSNGEMNEGNMEKDELVDILKEMKINGKKNKIKKVWLIKEKKRIKNRNNHWRKE